MHVLCPLCGRHGLDPCADTCENAGHGPIQGKIRLIGGHFDQQTRPLELGFDYPDVVSLSYGGYMWWYRHKNCNTYHFWKANIQ